MYVICIYIVFLGGPEDDQPVIDVIDACCPAVLEKCYPMLPPAEKAAAASTSNVDLQWIADRSSCVWTAGNILSTLLTYKSLHPFIFILQDSMTKIVPRVLPRSI